ncbi:class I SAM-dependent methyltransferase [Desulfonatronospira sp.]|uniref:class I SAM-dependent methyltransferase n=1 Tax=Desulfonatronospira sp. TaxID=1962951 RepID=UPI0025C0F8F9|nr:class I SAM-dependent methyltransferase [Desulfonatronospira sp.]
MNRHDPYFSAAPFYDLAVTPFLHRIRKAICIQLQKMQVKKVVDLGCGTGRQLELLHRQGFQACGVDFSAAMLKKAADYSSSTALFQADITRTPFLGHSFDSALLSLALHENPWTVQQAIIAEALRITRPKGALLLLDHCPASSRAGKIIHLLTHIPERLAGKNHYRNYLEFMKKGGLQGLFLSWPDLQATEIEHYYLGNLVLLKVKKL